MEAIERLLTVNEVAALMNVKRCWIYMRTRPAATDPIPHVKAGRYNRFRWSEVEQWLRQHPQEKSGPYIKE